MKYGKFGGVTVELQSVLLTTSLEAKVPYREESLYAVFQPTF